MKKSFLLFTLLVFSTLLFSQSTNAETINRIVTTTVNNGTQIDVFFGESINPNTLSSSTILINDKPVNGNTKFVFNRDGTQVRFTVEAEGSFTIQFKNLRTNSGKTVTSEKINLNGDSTWKKY